MNLLDWIKENDLIDSIISQIRWFSDNESTKNMRDVEVCIDCYNGTPDKGIIRRLIFRECRKLSYEIPQETASSSDLWSQLTILDVEAAKIKDGICVSFYRDFKRTRKILEIFCKEAYID